MALKSGDRAKETSTTTGTGTLNLGGAVSGKFTTFVASVGTGAVVTYAIEHQSANEWEVGYGTVTDAATDTLSRDKVLASSNAGALVSLSSGTKHVWVDAPASLIDGVKNDNLIWNQGPDIWARGSSFTGPTNSETANGYQFIQAGEGVVDVTRSTDAPTIAQARRYIPYSHKIDVTTLDATIGAAQACRLIWRVSGFDYQRIAQQEFTVSFWFKSTKTGIYSFAARNSGVDRSVVLEFTVNAADTWEFKTICVPASPSAGTWDYADGVGLFLSWCFAAGSDFTTTPGSWASADKIASTNQVNALDSTSNNILISQVKVEVGSVPTYNNAPDVLVPSLVCQGRLTLETGVAVSTTDQSAKTTLYFTPYKGNAVSLLANLFGSYQPKTYRFNEISIAVPSEVYRIYDVFVYQSSGALALELNAWDSGGQTTGTITGATNATPVVVTSASHGRSVGDLVGINGMVTLTAPNGKIWYLSNTTTTFTCEGSVGNGVYASGGTWYLIPVARTDAISLQNGVYVKTSNPTRLYVGTFMTGPTSGQTEDSTNRRLVWNAYNRARRVLYAIDTTDSWTYSTATWRAANGAVGTSTGIGIGQCWAITGLQEESATFNRYVTTGHSASNQAASPGVGINRCAANSAQFYGHPLSFQNPPNRAVYEGYLPLGFSYIQAVEQAAAVATMTWYSDNGSAVISGAGMMGVVLM